MKLFVVIVGILFLIAGVAGLVHPSISYHKQEEVAKVGPFKATVDEEKTTEIPTPVSIVLLVAGIGLIVWGARLKK
jgi:hypothetical protein